MHQKLNKKILICEDDEGILELCELVLAEAGYEIIAVADSTQIYEIIKQTNPDLLLVDLWMNGLSGEEIVTTLKSQDETKDMPIIVFSANNNLEFISKSIGADDYLAKPFPILELEKIVAKHIR